MFCALAHMIPTQHEHPYISAIVNDGSAHYDHDKDGTHHQIAGCTVRVFSIYISLMYLLFII